MTNNGEPNSNDSIAITLTHPKDGGLLFWDRWDDLQTIEQFPISGNLRVQAARFLDGDPGQEAPAGSLVTAEQLKAIVPAAIARWQAAGVDEALLQRLENGHSSLITPTNRRRRDFDLRRLARNSLGFACLWHAGHNTMLSCIEYRRPRITKIRRKPQAS